MKRLLVILMLLTCSLIACNAPVATPTQSIDAYPIPQRPTPNLPIGPRFTLTQPLYADDTVVHGRGLANVPIRIVDASLVLNQSSAAVLGQGVIASDGQFAIKVNPPLIKEHLVAIQIGDLSGTPFKYTDFLRGEGYSDRPLVGVVFDIVVVTVRPTATPTKSP